jgi:adenylate cyclase
MTASFRLEVLENGVVQKLSVNGEAREPPYVVTEPLVLGRKRTRERDPEPYALFRPPDGPPLRLVVARSEDMTYYSRYHVRLEPLPGGRVRVCNLDHDWKLRGGERVLGKNQSEEVEGPFRFTVTDDHPPGRQLSFFVEPLGPDDAPGDLQHLEDFTIGPGGTAAGPLPRIPAVAGQQQKELLGWLQKVMGVLQGAVGSADFRRQAARAMVEIVGLDSGRVLRLSPRGWEIEAQHPDTAGLAGWRPSDTILTRVREGRRTFWWQVGREHGDFSGSEELQTVLVSPLLDAQNQVVGALYGERKREGDAAAVGEVEATLVDVLACGVATGLAREEQEKAALEARNRFEQFFTPELARRLEADRSLLKGRQADVTVLFCDVRGFSRASAELGAEGTARWMNDVMEQLSVCVRQEAGVLVDYIGDELMAMWGAPVEQPDQAERAARAALAMLECIPSLNDRWGDQLHRVGPMAVGIGVHTGEAFVGNTGSTIKFKYGPLGDTVNKASRVQGLTKYLRCALLVTRDTRAKLGAKFIARRVVHSRVVNIPQTFDVFEVDSAEAAGAEDRRAFFGESEGALGMLEAEQFPEAARRAGQLLQEHRGDGPSLLTLSRATQMLVTPDTPFSKVWEPTGK